MRIDLAKNANNSKNTGALSRCKVCGRYYTWECPTELVYFDVKKGRKIPAVDPEHCGSSVCSDFWGYYEKCKQKEMNDLDMAKTMYLKRKGIM